MRQSGCAVQIGLNERPRAKQNLFFINEVSLDQGSFLLYIYSGKENHLLYQGIRYLAILEFRYIEVPL